MPIDDFVRDQNEDVPTSHPLLGFVRTRMKRGYRVELEVRVPPRFVGYESATIYLRLSRDGDEDLKSEEWDDDLNDGLVKLGVKAVDESNEKERFALALRASLRRPETRFGDGYFSSVLVKFVRESDFQGQAVVADVLAHVRQTNPNEGQAYSECREMIDYALRKRGRQLVTDLKYDVPQAVGILSAALAKYLDERFSVTNRRLLGLL